LENSGDRKKDHIDLAFRSIVESQDSRFYYEPLLSAMPTFDSTERYQFLGFNFMAPIWVSSMTGGTEKANQINRHLAQVCGKYKLGMGLGSCRPLLESDRRLEDFNVKNFLEGQPLFANLGIAQVEELLEQNAYDKILSLIDKISADGLIVHINPLQEWLQPEGDRYKRPPIETLEHLKNLYRGKLIVKEVGQGMGPASLKALLKLGVDAIEFGAFGGTNFSKLEILRSNKMEQYEQLVNVGHDPIEMIQTLNEILANDKKGTTEFIISGGIRGFLDGYYYINQLNSSAIYGQAGAFLKRAIQSYEALDSYVHREIFGWQLAQALLKVRK
jgi:isopentenyl-diphosphate delta-isomerase